MLHTLQCVSCQERFLFDESLAAQPITAGGHAYMKQPGRRAGEHGLYCPRCQVDNRKWLEIGHPRIYAELEASRRKKGSNSTGTSSTTTFSAGFAYPAAVHLFPNGGLPVQIVPAHNRFYIALAVVISITAAFILAATQVTSDVGERVLLVGLMAIMAYLLVHRMTMGWQEMREWQQLSKAGLRRRLPAIPSLLRSAVLIIIMLAVIVPLLLHVGFPILLQAVESFQEQPEPTLPERAVSVNQALMRLRRQLPASELAAWDEATADVQDILQTLGGDVEPRAIPAPPVVAYDDLTVWMALLLTLGILTLFVAYWGTNGYIQEIEHELPRPLFRDLGRLTPVALRDAQHALDLDGIHLHQVRWLSAVRNAQGGLSLHGVQNRDHVQVASYRVETDMYGRPVSIRVQDQFSTS